MTDRKKFNKYVKKLTEGAGEEESGEDEKPKKKSKKSKKQSESEEEESEEEVQQKKATVPPKLQIQAKAQPAPAPPAAAVGDLINLDFVAPAQAPPPQAFGGIDDFSDFQDAKPVDDFSDFQGAPQQNTQNGNGLLTNNGINMQGLMNMYNQNPSFINNTPGAGAQVLAHVNKYSALDAFSTQYNHQAQQQPHFGGMPQQQQQNPMAAFSGFGAPSGAPMQTPAGMGFGMQQQQQRPMTGQNNYQQQQPPQNMMGMPSHQTNMFAGMNVTVNLNQFGQMPQQQATQQAQPGLYNPYVLNNGFGQQQQQQQPAGPQYGFKTGPSFGNPAPMSTPSFMQSKPAQPVQQQATGNLYGGLVNLSNLGGQSSAGQGNGFGDFSMGGGSSTSAQNGQQKKDAFSGLMGTAWK
ncbi:hypothetical protein FGO68_gene7922 [Halteria grandinella]|uniref:Uncharacterized protein n=1 Tax=Halteria grandinella TaxID=5974 RepID=A0A8J8NTM1_HALGN|nr:hypothetical protein FGO68_gene7922 [Halteria grandinella]